MYSTINIHIHNHKHMTYFIKHSPLKNKQIVLIQTTIKKRKQKVSLEQKQIIIHVIYLTITNTLLSPTLKTQKQNTI